MAPKSTPINIVVQIIFLVILGFALVFAITTLRGVAPGTLSPTQVTPDPFATQEFRTPTPDISEITPVTPQPTPTNVVVSLISDLSPNLRRLDKFDIYVQHADGTVTLFLIGPLPPGITEITSELPEEILQALPLKKGDVIVYWLPPSPWRRVEPATPSTPEETPSPPTPTRIPYPES